MFPISTPLPLHPSLFDKFSLFPLPSPSIPRFCVRTTCRLVVHYVPTRKNSTVAVFISKLPERTIRGLKHNFNISVDPWKHLFCLKLSQNIFVPWVYVKIKQCGRVDLVLKICSIMWTRGEGIQNTKIFTNLLHGWSLTKPTALIILSLSSQNMVVLQVLAVRRVDRRGGG